MAADDQGDAVRPSQPLLFGAWVLVSLAVAWVGVSSFPAVARAMGLTEMRVVRRDFDRNLPEQAGVDSMRDFEQEKQDIGRTLDRLDRAIGDDDEPDSPFELVITARETTLRQTPSPKGVPTSKLAAGVPLIVISRVGVWVQVAHQTVNDSLEVGWVSASDVATR
ncbi:MAG: SH3 domain-containing protein [Myxococcales bacterium]|nr:SH3 domain-containing protein [Myxococcales bacterium]